MLQAALEAQYKPTPEAWKKALGVIGKSFPDTGRKFNGFKIHVSFFPGNLSADANGVLRVRKPDGSKVDVDNLLHNLLQRNGDSGRVHATLEVGSSPTPKVYSDDMTTAAPTIPRYFSDHGIGPDGGTALKSALVGYIRDNIKPKLQAFVERHGRPA
jgi:hypothetical protein